MNTFLEILKYTLPALIALGAVYLIIIRFMKNEEGRRNYEIRQSVANLVTPIKLSAYERLVLFLERITPESLVLRVKQAGMTNEQLQIALVEAIRQEYEHNFSQQLYISDQATVFVKGARESIVKLIQAVSSQVEPHEESTKLAIMIIEMYNSSENPPARVAIDYLKAEVRSYFG